MARFSIDENGTKVDKVSPSWDLKDKANKILNQEFALFMQDLNQKLNVDATVSCQEETSTAVAASISTSAPAAPAPAKATERKSLF